MSKSGIVVTIDIEDWAQSTLDSAMPITDRARRNVEYVLDVLADTRCRATCFVLGLFAEKYPECVRRIADEGHEIASHGYGHVQVFVQTQAQFREDIRRSKAQLEDMTGKAVVGYRAPFYSVTRESLWALSVLAEEGFVYDSSIYPVANCHYGIPEWPKQPVTVTWENGHRLVELPAATLSWLGRDWPVAGGGYHRLLPWPCIRWAIARTLSRDEAFVAYCHPYEFDPDEFANIPFRTTLKTRLHQGLGRRGFEAKFRRMVTEFPSLLARDLATGREWPTAVGRPCPA